MACLSQLHDTSNSAPIKLHAASDAVHPRANDHNMGLLEDHVTFRAMIGQVQIVGVRGPLGSDRVNLFDHGKNLPVTPQLPHSQLGATDRVENIL